MSARVPLARTLADDIAGEKPTEQLMRYVDSPEAFRRQLEDMHLNIESSPPSDEIRRMLKEGYRLRLANEYVNLLMLLDMAQKTYERLRLLDWSVWQSGDDFRFLTSDNPVVTVLPGAGSGATLGRSLAEPNIRVIFPLSPAACLFATRGGTASVQSVPGMKVRNINKAVMAMSERWLFASERSAKIAKVFDKIGGTGVYADDFYTPESNILTRISKVP